MLRVVSRSVWAAGATLLLAASAPAQTTALFEDFEDATVTYTIDPAGTEYSDFGSGSSGGSDFLTRTDGSNIASSYNVAGFNGTSFFAAQDLDGDGEAPTQTLQFSGIDITGLTGLEFAALFAEDDAADGNEDWDDTSDDNYVRVYASIDGGTPQLIFAIEGDAADAANGAPRVDTDFDGVGDGTEIVPTFARFTAAIGGAGSTLDLWIEIDLEDGDEDIAIDDVMVTGTAPVVPVACTTTSPLYLSAFATGSPGGVTVTNSSTTETVDLPDCTLAVFDGISELVTDTETAPAPLAPSASYAFAPNLPAGPGAVILSTADLGVGDEVSDAIGTVVAAVVYDASGAVFGECGRGPAGAEGDDLDPCDSDAGAASVSGALAALFGGAVASVDDAGLDRALTVAPNPTLGRTAVSFGLAEAGDVRVAAYDALGREVAVLLEGPRGPGRHEATLDASVLPAGLYVLRVTAGTDVRTTRLTVAR